MVVRFVYAKPVIRVSVSRVSLVPAPPGVFLPVHLSAKSCERVSCIDIKSCRSHCVLSVFEI